MRVSIIGTGYVGLVTGLCLADRGHVVVASTSTRPRCERLQRGEAPIHEVGLPELLARRHAAGRFAATTDLTGAVQDTDLTLLAVGTPFDGKCIDLSQVVSATRQVGAAIGEKSTPHVVVVKSTVVPGTTDGVVRTALEETSRRRVGDGLGLGVNPEFLTEGQAIRDFMTPDRIVIGARRATYEALRELYASFTGVPVIRTTNKSAEMIKYASNALLATMISFSNEFADLCSALGDVDVRDVMAGLHASAYLTVRESSGVARRPRSSVSSKRMRLRRQLPPEGRQRPGCSRRSQRRGHAVVAVGPGRQPSASRPSARSAAARARPARELASRSWAWLSSPIPTMFASRRPFRSSTDCCRGRPCPPSTRSR